MPSQQEKVGPESMALTKRTCCLFDEKARAVFHSEHKERKDVDKLATPEPSWHCQNAKLLAKTIRTLVVCALNAGSKLNAAGKPTGRKIGQQIYILTDGHPATFLLRSLRLDRK